MRHTQILLAIVGGIVLPASVRALEWKGVIVGDAVPGWRVRGESKDVWVVKDGMLQCVAGERKWGEWIGTEAEYTDVAVDFEYRMSPGGNSGLYLRTPPQGHPSSVSIEIQLLDDEAEKHKDLKPAQFTGSIYKLVAPAKRNAKPPGEWNHMRVTADRDHITVVLNGETIVDVDRRDCPELLNRSTRGAVGFQDHHTPVWFRNIRIADLAQDRLQRSAWWRDAKFGLFIHWGVYSVLGQGEWNMKVSRIPAAEYEKLTAQFNPTGFDAAEWVGLAKRAGQKYMVITSKHHDGFAMFDSKASDYTIVKAAPFKRDPIKELAQECARQDVRFGLYHSILDWRHPDYDPIPDWDPARSTIPTNFDRYLAYMTAQARELCTGYGPLACWWWDMPVSHEGHADRMKFARINAMIRELQPGILINNRSAITEDFDTPEQYIPATGIKNPDGSSKLWEACITLTTGHGSHPPTAWWGYDKNETEYKTPEFCIRMLIDVVSKGGNLLLNVGPGPDGRIQDAERGVLEAMGRWLAVNGEAIYGTTASPFSHLPFLGRATVKGDVLYVHVFARPADGRLVLPGLTNEVRSAKLLSVRDAAPLAASRGAGDVVVELPAGAPESIATVVALQLDGPPRVEPFAIRPEADGTLTLPATYAEIRARHGQRARFDTAGEQVYVGNWTSPNDHVCWQFRLAKPGRYEVVLNYALGGNSFEGKFEVGVLPMPTGSQSTLRLDDLLITQVFDAVPAAARLAGAVQATGGPTTFVDHPIGALELTAGTNMLLVHPVKLPPNDTLMNLRQVTLKPADTSPSRR